MQIKKSDWVMVPGFSLIGSVKRVARNGTWVDVNWRTHSKRMPATSLQVQTTIPLRGGGSVTDLTREKELAQGNEQ